MVGRYRALLIGNSTYPADEHNLQTLRGPIKDIAAVNRALIDKDTGLFADADVTLLPEVTSTRAVRALGKFFAGGSRDDVLLLYFSGHGKLDQAGRLHLCMQDTETTDLLSTAVSNVRINEFADASRARNIVIVLDCCYAGAFRGSDLGGAVAGPGRYVLSSCRGTQLANDATVDNGTSFFTQHLVDGLLTAADSDEDGYVGFSDIYAYVDRRLREAGKQIPARRVDGDGDLPLAKRPRGETVPATPEPMAQTEPRPDGAAGVDRPSSIGVSAAPAPRDPARAGDSGAATAGRSPPTGTSPARGARFRWTRGRVLAVVAAVVAGGASTAALLLFPGANGDRSTAESGTYTADAPWRLRLDGTAYGDGCAVTLTKEGSGDTVTWRDLYSVARFQVPSTGSFRWQTNDNRCLVTPFAGAGSATLPLLQEINGDTDAIKAPPEGLAVQIVDNKGSACTIRLFDAANGDALDIRQWEQGDGNFTLHPEGRPSVYISNDNCVIRVSAQG
jgi:hypothetical protein